MKLFKIPAGTRGYLLSDISPMPRLRSWIVPEDRIAEREELIADPITLENGEFIGIGTIGYDLVSNGYSLFNPPRDNADGWKNEARTIPKYILAVPFGAVETL